ncbi:MAG TPA: exopolyphosphatase [Rhodobacteraceae bacterium]|nr:exopolyphosphatase [Paracoccaceae bacterium]
MDPQFDEWGPFGRPLFNDPATRALARVGVVDVGSNSVRLVVFDGAARSPAYFYNEKIMCGLGAGLPETGNLNPKGRIRALAAIRRFQLLAEDMGIPPLTAVATAAVRDADDGPDFCADVLRETGLELYVIDGAEEARLTSQGVLLGWPTAKGLVCDIGGSSMELAEVSDGQVGRCITSPLGPLKLSNIKGGKKGLKNHINAILDQMFSQIPVEKQRLFLVGGSWRAIAKLDMLRRNYPLTVLHEYRMTPRSVMQTVKWINEHDLDDLQKRSGISTSRIVLIHTACEILKRVVRKFKPREIAISAYGIREGMLYEQMPQQLRDRDPLIEACRYAEDKDARWPGFGRKLYKFIIPLFKGANDDRKRLIRATCLLHDVTWRAHPDYRAEVCFDNATRANLGGLRHRERVFLGLALLHRYKNGRNGTRFEPLVELLDEKDAQQAEVVGKAIRFGAMLTMDAINDLADLRYYPKKKQLELRLGEKARGLFGEVAEARFMSLAASLETEVQILNLRK